MGPKPLCAERAARFCSYSKRGLQDALEFISDCVYDTIRIASNDNTARHWGVLGQDYDRKPDFNAAVIRP